MTAVPEKLICNKLGSFAVKSSGYMRIVLFVILIVTAVSCKKKSTQNAAQNPVPSVPVQLKVYPNDPLYFKIQVTGGWMYIDGGINGIVIYRKSDQEFVAIERSSTYAPNDVKSRVMVMKDNFTLRDTISDSQWRMFDGSVTKGPATWSLRLYGTSYDGNVLRIAN
jgi:hypothetical protein